MRSVFWPKSGRLTDRGFAARSPIGGWVVIEPLRPLLRECGPRLRSHHAALNGPLIRSGGFLAFARSLLGHVIPSR